MLKKIFNTLLTKPWGEIKLLTREMAFTVGEENIIRTVRDIKKTTSAPWNEYIILDIGAFDGNTSLRLSKAFPGCKILAFEPNPDAYKTAAKNVKVNPAITLKNIALSNSSGQVTFNITENGVSSSINSIDKTNVGEYQKKELSIKKQVNVQAQTLDNLQLTGPILLMKIDTQGHEISVLEGAIATLPNVKYVLAEMNNHNIYDKSSKYYDVDKWLRDHNFTMVDLIVTHRKEGTLVTEFDALYLNNKLA